MRTCIDCFITGRPAGLEWGQLVKEMDGTITEHDKNAVTLVHAPLQTQEMATFHLPFPRE